MPLLLTLCIGLLWWGWSERGWRRVALAGVCAGLLPYTYMAARIVPVLFVLFGLSLLLPLRVLDWGKVRKELRWVALFAGVAGMVAAPLLVHFSLYPDHFFLRSKHLWIFDPVHSQGDPLGTLLTNVWDHLSLLVLRGDSYPRQNYAGRPMLNPVEGLFFLFGRGRGCLALALACLPTAAHLAGDHDDSGFCLTRSLWAQFHAHLERNAGHLSVSRGWRVGGVQYFEWEVLSEGAGPGRRLPQGLSSVSRYWYRGSTPTAPIITNGR